MHVAVAELTDTKHTAIKTFFPPKAQSRLTNNVHATRDGGCLHCFLTAVMAVLLSTRSGTSVKQFFSVALNQLILNLHYQSRPFYRHVFTTIGLDDPPGSRLKQLSLLIVIIANRKSVPTYIEVANEF